MHRTNWSTASYMVDRPGMIRVSSLSNVEERGASERVEIIFDERELFKRAVKRHYEDLRADESESYKQIMPIEPWFKDDKDLRPLQAADLVAGVLRRMLHRNDNITMSWRHLYCRTQIELRVSKQSMIFNRDKLLLFRGEIANTVLRMMEELGLNIDTES